jgi:hypothetical protein
LAVEEMAGETVTATVTTRTTARTMMVGTTTAVAASFLPNRQQSTKRGSRRNGGDDNDGDGNGNSNGDADSANDNGRGVMTTARMMTMARTMMVVAAVFLPDIQQ